MAILAKLGWKVVGGVGGSLAGAVAQRAVQAAWKAVRHQDPPTDTEDPKLAWPDALAWAAATAAGFALTQLTARRLAAIGWERATGSPPPGRKRSGVGRSGVPAAVVLDRTES